MKISFNDKSLHTTFEYPSESSLAQEEAEEEEEEEDDGEEEEVGLDSEKSFSLFLPRATFVSSVGPESPRLPDGSSGNHRRLGWAGWEWNLAHIFQVSIPVLFGSQACPATLPSIPWPSASGRNRHWCRLQVRWNSHRRRSW